MRLRRAGTSDCTTVYRVRTTGRGITMRTCIGMVACRAALFAAAAIAGCATQAPHQSAASQRLADREAIEEVVSRANLGFDLSDPDLFANAFGEVAEYVLDEKGPVFGYDKDDLQGKGREPEHYQCEAAEDARAIRRRSPTTREAFAGTTVTATIASSERAARAAGTGICDLAGLARGAAPTPRKKLRGKPIGNDVHRAECPRARRPPSPHQCRSGWFASALGGPRFRLV